MAIAETDIGSIPQGVGCPVPSFPRRRTAAYTGKQQAESNMDSAALPD